VVTVKYTLIAKRKIPALTFADSENNYDLNPNVSSTVSATKTAYPNRLRQRCCGALVRMCVGFRMPASDSGATYTSGRRPKVAKERTRGGWGAENAAHSAMGIWLLRKV